MFSHLVAHNLWWLAVGGAGVAARYVRHRVRPAVVDFGDERVTSDLLERQAAYGYNAHSLVGIAPKTRLWSCWGIDGAITFNEFGKVWLVPGDPLAHPDQVAELTRRFLEAAHDEGRFVAFVPATERFARQAASLNLITIKVGAAPYFDLSSWGPRGDRAKKARAGVNQARRAGVIVSRVERVDEALVRQTASLCRSWLEKRRCAMKFGWLFELDPFQHADRKRFFTARDAEGKLVGFLAASPIPARDGWYLEDVLRLPDAPAGTADLLVVEALNFLKLEGAKVATLGTAPLAREGSVDPEVHNHDFAASAVRRITSCFAGLYNFDGLRRFKAKFAPSFWESEYILLSRSAMAPPHVIRAFIKAIAPGGASDLVARQILRALKRDRSEFEEPGAVAAIAGKSVMNHEQVKREPKVESSSQALAARHYLGQFISVDGHRLHYLSKGTGQPVVFIHGNPGSHQDFSMTVLGDVAETHRVIAFDRPGHGYSERKNRSSATVEVQARLLRDALNSLSIEQPLVVGHSWGGAVALAMAIEDQRDLAGLVLLAPAAYPGDSPEWWSVLFQIPIFGTILMNTLTPLVARSIVRTSLKHAFYPDPVQENHLRAAEALWTRREQIKACANDDQSLDASLKRLSARYAEISIPVVIVTGDSDLLVNPKGNANRLHQTLANAELITLSETGHQLPQTRPESVIDAIERASELANRASAIISG